MGPFVNGVSPEALKKSLPAVMAEHFDRLYIKRFLETIIRRTGIILVLFLWSVGNECEEVNTVDGWEVMKELRGYLSQNGSH